MSEAIGVMFHTGIRARAQPAEVLKTFVSAISSKTARPRNTTSRCSASLLLLLRSASCRRRQWSTRRNHTRPQCRLREVLRVQRHDERRVPRFGTGAERIVCAIGSDFHNPGRFDKFGFFPQEVDNTSDHTSTHAEPFENFLVFS
jgi:hypothetical protein